MLFNSFEFIFVFLPIVVIIYFILNKKRLVVLAKCWLIICSLFFYSWWNIIYLPLLLLSIMVNFWIGCMLESRSHINRRLLLSTGIIFNVGLLGYFKYADFFINNINYLLTRDLVLLEITLPLAISFFTFQQIAYLIDVYNHETNNYDFVNYVLFVSFFPQLIAGPIVHHKEMLPQFLSNESKVINFRNINLGVFIFIIGLFKKIVIADSFAVWATKGFGEADNLTFIEAWITSLSYTFQLYFDFSGYSDMAIGLALLFNIRLPINFFSPYKALNIQDFWRRWHITLTRFLTKYIYIPLGGSRIGKRRTYINILVIFLISGLWHGAGWTFVFWGLLHGLATVIHRYWLTFNISMNKLLAWFITFNFVNVSWVFFKAETWTDAMKVIQGMFGAIINFPYSLMKDFEINILQPKINTLFVEEGSLIYPTLILCVTLVIILVSNNSFQLMKDFKPTRLTSIYLAFLVTVIMYVVFKNFTNSEFIYFNF